MGALGCTFAPSLLSQVLGQDDPNRAEQSFPVVPDSEREMDINWLLCQGQTLWWYLEGLRWYERSETHTPSAEHAPKHALIFLAASAPCQLNGWASDSSLHIPTVPSVVKPSFGAAHMVITTPTVTMLNTENTTD